MQMIGQPESTQIIGTCLDYILESKRENGVRQLSSLDVNEQTNKTFKMCLQVGLTQKTYIGFCSYDVCSWIGTLHLAVILLSPATLIIWQNKKMTECGILVKRIEIFIWFLITNFDAIL